MATATDTAPKTPIISMEVRTPNTIGLDPSAEEKPEQTANTVVDWSQDLQQPYGFDNVIKSNEGTPYDHFDGAAAFYRAVRRLTKMDPQGINWGKNPPVMIQVQIQEFLYEAPDGSHILESDLDDFQKWNTERIVAFLDANVPSYEIPRHYSDAMRIQFLEALKASLHIIKAPVKTIYVPWGAMRIPGMDGIEVVAVDEDGREYGYEGKVFRLAIMGKKKDRKLVDQIVQAVTEELQHRSIFKGRCFVYDNGNVSFHDPFSATRPEELIFNEFMRYEIENEVFGLFRNSDQCRKMDHSLLNSKIVAAGEPGTGKTEFTNWAAQEALRNGFTAAFMTPTSDENALDKFKRWIARYTPVLGVIEDMEKSMPDLQALTTKQQHEERSKLLDRIDGGQTKGKEVMWILTTNYPQMWISAMARPGRTDTYLVFEPLDRPGFEALLRKKIGPWLADDVDFDALWELIGDMSSSFLSGYIKKASKYLLGKPEGYRLGNVELASAARSLRRQWVWYDELRDSEESSQQPTLQQAADSLFSPIIQRELANIVH